MHDSLYRGRCLRTLNIIDEGVHEALAIEADSSLPAPRVIRVLEQQEECRGLPAKIRVDNGPELQQRGYLYLTLKQPSKPTQIQNIERCNRILRY